MLSRVFPGIEELLTVVPVAYPPRSGCRPPARPPKPEKNAKIAPLARAFDVPVSRLPARLHSRQALEASANAMIQRDIEATGHQVPVSVGKMWVYNFVKRLPDGLYWVKQKPAERERIEDEGDSILHTWYDRFEPFVKRISLSNIYNFDKTSFQLGQGKTQKVISRNRYRTRLLSGERGDLGPELSVW
ncbi:FAD dependent oxidoreductase [Penicillium atrosanguineum]|uniref:FAD dependent oxidoreductase n=1 Tax=Penicillium atrosanguineum TaxID=1132637 RepID=UPI0023847BB9|nr:FAD dependent oxidoreductase [Penicillium atrosanguineum]KAJ5304340.1 FAD dependent oxidoreductase [Penicillium atrosanguineum]